MKQGENQGEGHEPHDVSGSAIREKLWPEVHSPYPEITVIPDEIAGILEQLSVWQNLVSHAKGFWDEAEGVDVTHGTKFMLMTGELGEAFEALREGNPPSKKIPGYSCVEEELADAILRILDWGHEHGYDIGAAVVTKLFYNETRPRLHGKKF